MVKPTDSSSPPKDGRGAEAGGAEAGGAKAGGAKADGTKADGAKAGGARSRSSPGLPRERARLEALVGEIRALQSGGGADLGAERAAVARPRPRWLTVVDVAVMLLVLQALVFGTPLGSLLQQGWAWMVADPSDVRPLLSYFTSPSASRLELGSLQSALRTARRRRTKPDRERDTLSTAVAFLLAEGKGGKHFDVRLPAAGLEALRSVAVVWPGEAAPPKQREAALRAGLSRLRQTFGQDEAAVAALVVAPDILAFALERAKVSGVDAPARFDRFAKYLTLEDRMAAASLVHAAFALSAAYSMAWPIEGKASVTSSFGPRPHPVLGEERLHKGVDLGVPVGTPVRAAHDGRVVFAGEDGANGRFIRLDHGHGLTTTYCHLDRHSVRKGEIVRRAMVIAASGNTGRSTGPHLHFQVELNGAPIDPELFK